MTNPITMTGGQFALGTAVDNTGTDVFSLYGMQNTIVTGTTGSAGNLYVFGNPFGNAPNSPALAEDGATTIDIGNSTAVTDQITLDQSYNLVASSPSTSITGSSVNIMFDPQPFYTYWLPNDGAGFNTVNLNAATSIITVADDAIDPAGHNSATIANAYGKTSVELTGAFDNVVLTGDKADTVVTGANTYGSGGNANVSVGALDDDAFGYKSSITVAGSNNNIFVGDANATIGGGYSNNTVAVGDGNDSVTLYGSWNSVTVGGGSNTVSLGGGNSLVNILGFDWTGGPPTPGDPDPLSSSPNDFVYLSGMYNTVNATYENVTIDPSSGYSLFNLGNGDNNVTANGDKNTVNVGDGTNVITLSGNSNGITVTDPTGSGSETINLGGGSSDSVSLDMAGGSVIGTGLGTTWVNQDPTATNSVMVNLNNGRGVISLGDGINIVKANGNLSKILVGDGANNITALGAGDTITAGNGGDIINAGFKANVSAGNGNDNVTTGGLSKVVLGDGQDTVSVGGGSAVTVGNGNDTITSNGPGGFIKVTGGNGNDGVTLAGIKNSVTLGNGSDTVTSTGFGAVVSVGSGNDTVTTGNHSFVTIDTAGAAATDSVTVGDGSTVVAGGGYQTINGTSGDKFYLNDLLNPSNINVTGSNNLVALGENSSATVTLNNSQVGDVVVVQGADTAGTYTGTVTIANFGQNSQLDLQTLFAHDGTALNNWGAVASHLTGSAGNYQLALAGTGVINFTNAGAMNPGQFVFTSNYGAV
jgi:hypothetical protein